MGFTPSIEWDVSPWVLDLLGLVRNLGFDGDMGMPAGSVQCAAMAFVAMTYAIMAYQETVEEHVFMQDEGNWQSIWIICDAFTTAVATVLFMPVRSLPVGYLPLPLPFCPNFLRSRSSACCSTHWTALPRTPCSPQARRQRTAVTG